MSYSQVHSPEHSSTHSETSRLDGKHIFHPCFHLASNPPAIPIVRGKGTVLYDENGKEYLDLISSWWVNTHGHAHPKIAETIAEQAKTLEQVIFAHCTHPTAVQLATRLTQFHSHLPRVFYADNGSSACEVALKLSYQYWQNIGEPQRTRFLAFEDGYHGETVGAMSVSGASVYLKPFENLMFSIDRIPFPATWWDDANVKEKEDRALAQLESYLKDHHQEVAAFILEPLIQGAGGMNMCSPAFLKRLVDCLQSHGILVIFDEIMTGFGRTGEMFACHKADTQPDIICLSKGLTAGFLPLSAVMCREDIFQSFIHDGYAKGFGHSHSFTANPLGCAAAIASLDIFQQENTIEKIEALEKGHIQRLQTIRDNHPHTRNHRVMGGIAAFEVDTPQSGYTSNLGLQLRSYFQEHGCLLRPLGNTVYVMPPYCITEEELNRAYQVINEACKVCTQW